VWERTGSRRNTSHCTDESPIRQSPGPTPLYTFHRPTQERSPADRWAGLAQFTEENVKKGDRIYVEGRLEYDAHEREGRRIPTADVSVRELVLLTAREAEVQVAT